MVSTRSAGPGGQRPGRTRATRPAPRLLFPTERAGLRVTWHEDDEFVLSLWHADVCAGTAPLGARGAAEVASFLVTRLGERGTWTPRVVDPEEQVPKPRPRAHRQDRFAHGRRPRRGRDPRVAGRPSRRPHAQPASPDGRPCSNDLALRRSGRAGRSATYCLRERRHDRWGSPAPHSPAPRPSPAGEDRVGRNLPMGRAGFTYG